jgi:hypothetical protein
MHFWIRELMGWVLVAVGLYIMLVCIGRLLAPGPPIISAPIVAFMAIIVFRGGIHLLKVAVAARVASQPSPEAPRPAPVADGKKTSATPWDW